MTVVRLRPRALDDIRAARDWYERESSGLGIRFAEQVDQSFRREYGCVSDGIQGGAQSIDAKIPICDLLRVDGDHVTIMRVLHQSRHPDAFRR